VFGPNLTKSQSRQDRRRPAGPGWTALGNREISLVDMGKDMAGVPKKLGYNKVDVLGYSMGAGVAFHPPLSIPMVRRPR
jgi:pimeloyl-ACP methyl ester carboxylesterase